jgi:hypothetical protein
MSTADSAPTLPELSPLGAVADVLRRPQRTFAALVRRPTWWLPFVAGVLLSAVFSVVMTDKLDYDAAMRQAIEKRSARSGQTMSKQQTDDAIDRAVEVQRKMAPFSPTIGAAIYAFVFFLIALVLAFAGNAFGAEAKIPVFLAIYAYAQIPVLLRSAVAVVRLFLAADTSLTFDDLGRLGAIGPAALLSPKTTPPLAWAAASSCDLLVMATVYLLVIAFRTIPGLSRRTATILPVALWGCMVLLRLAWAAIFG